MRSVKRRQHDYTLSRTDRKKRKIILGVARTGAKFTPGNHKVTEDRIIDAINAGDMITITEAAMYREFALLYGLGVRYFHEHARNPETREQTTDLEIYRRVSRIARVAAPDGLLSFGGSRNGPEIRAAIAEQGEIARVAQAGLSLEDGGAHFVTTQAAIELIIAMDMRRQGFVHIDWETGSVKILKPLADYTPSERNEAAKLEVNSTDGGANYGSSSAALQMETLRWTIAARALLELAYEVEWTQEGPSAHLTWYLANAIEDGIRRIGRLNITILFGFSPRLPFPEDYAAFRRMVEMAHAIAIPAPGANQSPLKVSVAVGAAVLARDAPALMQPVDVGPLKGMRMGPMERLAVYAAQPDSGVDILRVGLEDTPYLLDAGGMVVPATNPLLVERVRGILDAHEVAIETDRERLQAFAAA